MSKPLRLFGVCVLAVFLVAGAIVYFTAGNRNHYTMPLTNRAAISDVLGYYFAMQRQLANGNAESALHARKELESAVEALESVAVPANTARRLEWDEVKSTLSGVPKYTYAPDLFGLRADFARLSDRLIWVVTKVGHAHYVPIRLVHCSMAFNNTGGDWLQDSEKIRNPYFGKEMLECGEVRVTFPPGR